MAKHLESDQTKHSPAEESKAFDWFAAAFPRHDAVNQPPGSGGQRADRPSDDRKPKDSPHARQTSDGKDPALAHHTGGDPTVSGPITYNIPELKSISVFDKAILNGDLKTLKTEVEKYHGGANRENELEWMMQKVHRDMAEHNIYVNTREVGVKIPGSKFNDVEQEISIVAKSVNGHDSKMVSLVSEKSQSPEVKTPLGHGRDNRPQVYVPSKEDANKAFAEIIAQAKKAH